MSKPKCLMFKSDIPYFFPEIGCSFMFYDIDNLTFGVVCWRKSTSLCFDMHVTYSRLCTKGIIGI